MPRPGLAKSGANLSSFSHTQSYCVLGHILTFEEVEHLMLLLVLPFQKQFNEKVVPKKI